MWSFPVPGGGAEGVCVCNREKDRERERPREAEMEKDVETQTQSQRKRDGERWIENGDSAHMGPLPSRDVDKADSSVQPWLQLVWHKITY